MAFDKATDLSAHFSHFYKEEKELPKHTDVFVDSAKRVVTGVATSASFQTILAKPPRDVEMVSLIMFSINKTLYNVTAANQNLDFNDGVAQSVQIPVGSYTAASLATQIAASMNAVSTNWSCAVSALTFLTTISRTSGTASLLFGSGSHAASSIASLLGFAAADQTGALSYTGTTAVDLAFPEFAFIKIAELGHESTTNGSLTGFTFCVPIVGNSGSVVFYQNTGSLYANTVRCNKTNLGQLTIALTDANNNPLNLNSGNWQMLLRCYSKPL